MSLNHELIKDILKAIETLSHVIKNKEMMPSSNGNLGTEYLINISSFKYFPLLQCQKCYIFFTIFFSLKIILIFLKPLIKLKLIHLERNMWLFYWGKNCILLLWEKNSEDLSKESTGLNRLKVQRKELFFYTILFKNDLKNSSCISL